MALQMFSNFNVSNVTFSDVRKNAKGGKAVYLIRTTNYKAAQSLSMSTNIIDSIQRIESLRLSPLQEPRI